MAQQVKIGKAVLELVTDGSGVVSGLKMVEGEFEKKGRSITAKGVAIGAAIGTAIGTLAVAAVRKLGAEFADLAQRGIAMAPVVTSFHNLAASINQSGEAMLRASREGAAGLVADLDLMQAANKAMLLGLPVTTDSLGTMAKAAVVLGKAMGQGPTKSFDDLITALGRSSPMILDNLGLSVKVGEANEKYAAALGKTAESLTDAEKKTAFYNAAMEAARKKVDEVGGIQLTLADRLAQVKIRFQNFTDALGVAIAKSPVLAAGLDVIGQSLSDAMGTDSAGLVQTLIGYVNDFAIKLVAAAQAGVFLARGLAAAFAGLKTIFLGVSTVLAGVVFGIGGAVEGMLRLAAKIPGVGGAFDAAIAAASNFNQTTRESIGELAGMTAEAAKGVVGQDAFGRTLDGVAGTLATMKSKMEAAAGQQVKLGAETKKTTAVIEDHAEATKAAAAEAKKFEEIAQKERDALKSMGLVTQRDVNTELDELAKLQARATKEGVSMVAFLRSAEQRMKDMAEKAKTAGVHVAGLTEALQDVRAELNRLDPKPVLDLPRLFEQGARAAEHMLEEMEPVTAETMEAGRQAILTKNAYERLGIDTQRSLRDTYEAFRRAYEDMAASGTATEGELREAWRKVQEAGVQAGLVTQSVWKSRVLPAVKGVMESISRSMADHVVSLIGHANRWKDAAKGIWEDFKRSVMDILSNVLNYFINSFLNGMLNAILGQQGPMQAAFGNLFRAPSPGGGSGSLLDQGFTKFIGKFAGNNIVAGIMSGLQAGAVAYGLYKFWDTVISAWTGGPSPERFDRLIGFQDGDPNRPVYAPGIEQDEYERRYGTGPNPNAPIDPDTGEAVPEFDEGQNSPNYDRGTPRLDFQRFKWGQWARLHGTEAVIPQGGGHQLAREIAAALPPPPHRGDAGITEDGIARALVSAIGPMVSRGDTRIFIGTREIREFVVEENTRSVERNDGGGASVGPTDRYARALAPRLKPLLGLT